MSDLPNKKFIGIRYWPSWLLVVLLWCWAKLPFRWSMAIGRGLGWLAWRIMKKRRRVALINLQLCFPELSAQQHEKIVADTFRAFGQGIVSAAIAWWGSPAYVQRLTYSITGLEILQKNLAAKRGTLMIHPHLYTLEISGRILSEVTTLGAVYQRQSSEFFDQLIFKQRMKHSVRIINRSHLREFIRTLQDGAAIVYLPDQDFGPNNSVFAPFFNVPTATATSTARIAKLSGAAVVFVDCIPRADLSGYDVTITEPLANFPTDDEVYNATIINQNIEQIIRKQISNYMWLHRRFKSRPPGMSAVYD